MKKLILLIIFVGLLFFVQPVLAVNTPGQLRKEIREEIRNEILQNLSQTTTSPAEMRRQIREETREALREQKQTWLESLKNKLKKFRWAARITGTITAKTDASLTVDSNGKTYIINITDKTQLRRRFWGKSDLTEFLVGHQVIVIGRWTDENQTTIDARLIRNLSIERRWGVFFGIVTIKNADNFVVDAVKRGTQTVYFGTAKFIKRNQQTMTYAELQVGDRVRVKGVWDRTTNKIIEVDEVKDFSLPPQPKTSPGPTETVTLTPTPTSIPISTPTSTPTPTPTPSGITI